MTIIGTTVQGTIPESAEGIPLSSRRGKIGASEFARRWMDWVDSNADDAELEFGKRIARKHQVYAIDVKKGTMAATVAELRAQPMSVVISFEPPSPSFLDDFTECLLNNPIAIASLFANRKPDDLDAMVESSGGMIPPEGMSGCTCNCGVITCRHAVAAHCVFTEQLDENPWLCLELLGRSREYLCNVVRQTWGDASIPEDHERPRRIADDSQPFYGEVPPEGTALAELPPFDAIERLGIPPFFPADERNVKRTIEKLYHD